MGNHQSSDPNHATPKSLSHRNRILSVDPRSPTAEILRTPIVVTKTPEGALHDPLDPRSPTVGIDRTPLTTQQMKQADAYTPEMETEEHVNKNLFLDNVDRHLFVPPFELEGSIEATSTEFDTLGVTGIEDISLDDFPNSESTRLVPEDKLMMDITEKVWQRKPSKKSKIPQPKELFPLKSSISRDITRSPLSTRTVDMNSPAKIVQRKQIKDVDKKMTCTQENGLSRFIVREKENM